MGITAAIERESFYWELPDGQQFAQRSDALRYAESWGYLPQHVRWVDPNAPWEPFEYSN